MEPDEQSDAYFQKELLLIGIKNAERAALWSFVISLSFAALFAWRFDMTEGEEAVLMLVALMGGAIVSETQRLKAMLLRNELRELIRHGAPPVDREVADINKKLWQRRWWRRR